MTISSRQIEWIKKLSSISFLKNLVFGAHFCTKASHGQYCIYGLKTTLKLLVHVLAIVANSYLKIVFSQKSGLKPPPPLNDFGGCHPTHKQPPTIRIPQAIPQSTPQAIPQVIPQAIPQPIPLPTVAPVVPQLRQRLDDVTILYNTVTDKVNGGLSLSQALAQVNLSKWMFQRRRVIAETYISLPECVKSSL